MKDVCFCGQSLVFVSDQSFKNFPQIPLINNSHEDSWTSLVAQMVKRLSTMRETRVRSLGWEDPLEKEMAIASWEALGFPNTTKQFSATPAECSTIQLNSDII